MILKILLRTHLFDMALTSLFEGVRKNLFKMGLVKLSLKFEDIKVGDYFHLMKLKQEVYPGYKHRDLEFEECTIKYTEPNEIHFSWGSDDINAVHLIIRRKTFHIWEFYKFD